ncbi:hypothetical protein M011DRAFT_111254 [Sporormia fimetaria CBS 119925]|uniref:Uncharacterized protein n=1 Tax=Sporormia fimetaria CBS 119925 TaxID=1340428 RepID=A0A6A6VL62_9PLEO|nr:hypothetical protein M011DRAFT_111254 [Sporormia fimetaria CBS 119925]
MTSSAVAGLVASLKVGLWSCGGLYIEVDCPHLPQALCRDPAPALSDHDRETGIVSAVIDMRRFQSSSWLRSRWSCFALATSGCPPPCMSRTMKVGRKSRRSYCHRRKTLDVWSSYCPTGGLSLASPVAESSSGAVILIHTAYLLDTAKPFTPCFG